MKITIQNCSDLVAAMAHLEVVYERSIANWLGLEYEGYAGKFRVKKPYFGGSKVIIQPAYGNSFYVALNVANSSSGKHPGTKPGIWKHTYSAALTSRESLVAIVADVPPIEVQTTGDTVVATMPEILCRNGMTF